MRERGFNKASVRSQYIQQLISETSRTWLRKLLRDTQFMRVPGKLLFRVDYLSSQGNGMTISQFLEETEWGPLNFLVVDLCPGTGGEEGTDGRKMSRVYRPS